MAQTVTNPAKARERGHLLRILGLGFGVAVGVGGIIGGGILRSPGSVLNHVPLPWLALALWGFGAVHALLGANIVAEVMTSVPKSGGLFNVAGRAFGDFGALLVGWTDWLVNAGSVAALSIAAAEFLAIIFPSVGTHLQLVGAAIALVLLLLNWIGIREGSLSQIIVSAAKAALLVGIIILIFLAGHSHQASAKPVATSLGVTLLGVIVAYQLIVAAYGGWVTPAYFAEEDTNSGRNIPRGIFLSILSVAAIYLLMNGALIYALPIERMRVADLPVSLAVADLLGSASLAVVAGIAIVTVVGCINASIMVGTRILHGLARDGFLPAMVSRVNRGGTPDVALGITAIVAVLLALTGQFETVFLITGALAVFVNVLIDASFFKLRRTEPGLPRPYTAIGYPWLPLTVLILDAGLVVAFLSADLKSAFFMMVAVALCIPLTLIARRRTRTGI